MQLVLSFNRLVDTKCCCIILRVHWELAVSMRMLSFPITKIKRLFIIPLLCALATATLFFYFILIPTDFVSFPRVQVLLFNVKSQIDTNNSEIAITNQIEKIDEKDPAIDKWKEDPECSNFSISFVKPNTFVPRALVSFPGSGNTWIRHLIESSTGIFTGSIYNDENLTRAGLLGEGRKFDDGTTIVQKTHHFSTIDQSKAKLYMKLSVLVFQYRGILVIRNPYDALLSFWNLQKTESHTGNANESSFLRNDWKMFVEVKAKSWADLIQIWIQKSTDLHVVQYDEELKANTERELLRILEYLKQPINSMRVKCTLKHSEGHFRRNHGHMVNKSKSVSAYMQSDVSGKFTLHQIVQNQIKQVNKFFLEFGYPLKLFYKILG